MIYGQAADKRLQMGREKDMYLRMGRLAAHQYRVTPSLDAAISPRTLQCLLINDRPCEDDISSLTSGGWGVCSWSEGRMEKCPRRPVAGHHREDTLSIHLLRYHELLRCLAF